MKIFFIFSIIILILSNAGLSKNLKNSKKGPFVMNDILPEVITCKIPVIATFNSEKEDELYAISISGAIYETSLNQSKLNSTCIDSVRFSAPCKNYFKSASGTFLYGYGMRDFHVVDIKRKIEKNILVSFHGNESILEVTILNEEKQTFLITVYSQGWTHEDSFCCFVTYDFEANKIVNKSQNCYGGIYHYVSDQKMFFQQWAYAAPPRWFLTDNTMLKLDSNDLSKELTNYMVETLYNNISFEIKKMIGFFRDKDEKEILSIVQWNDGFKDPKITPFTFQKPKDRYIWTNFQFSLDGKWVKGTSQGKGDNTSCILFYHSDNKYPGGLSLAIHGSESTQDVNGSFITTKEYGTVYLDISRGMEGLIYMYRMNDVLWQITRRAKEMVE